MSSWVSFTLTVDTRSELTLSGWFWTQNFVITGRRRRFRITDKRKVNYALEIVTRYWYIGHWLFHLKLLGQSRFKPCLWSGYFLLWSKYKMFSTFIQLTNVKVHEYWCHNLPKRPFVWEWAVKKSVYVLCWCYRYTESILIIYCWISPI